MEQTEKSFTRRVLNHMISDRATWLKWIPVPYAVKARYQNEPPFKSHEVIGSDRDEIERRFQLLAKKRGRHIGAWDRDKKRFVVLRTSYMDYYEAGVILWELEQVRNKSTAYCRYRGLNSRWRQDMIPLKNYSIAVAEGEDLGIELAHVDNEERTSLAYVGMLCVDKLYHGTKVWRIVGVSNTGKKLKVMRAFALDTEHETEEHFIKGGVLRVLTMGCIMNWVLKLKTLMNECDV